MSVKIGEIGKIIRVNAFFDMSASTDLKLNFTRADGSTLTVDAAAGVTAPAVQITDPILGVFEPNEYWEYPTASSDITVLGTYEVNGEYIEDSVKLLIGLKTQFEVIQ